MARANNQTTRHLFDGCPSGFWRGSWALWWENSEDRRIYDQIEAAGLGDWSPKDRLAKLKREFQTAQENKQELMQTLLQMMEAHKGLILRVK